MANGLEDREDGDVHLCGAAVAIFHPSSQYLWSVLVNKGGPRPHGAHSPATYGWMDIQFLLALPVNTRLFYNSWQV